MNRYTRKFPLFIALAFLLISCDERKARLEYLVRDNSLNGYYSLDKNSVTMYRSPGDKKNGIAECVLYSDEYRLYGRLFNKYDLSAMCGIYSGKGTSRFTDDMRSIAASANPALKSDRYHPLGGLTVALDPGHCARTFEEAVREGKYLLIKNGTETIRFFESELNLRTAILLGSMLEADGASVIYTRPVNADNKNDCSRYRLPASKAREMGWINADTEKRIISGLASQKELFNYYSRVSDLACRAENINKAAPDISLSIHYNMTFPVQDSLRRLKEISSIMENNNGSDREKLLEIEDVVRRTRESDVNYSVVFVPGAFMAGELGSVEARMNFLRLIVTDDLDRSIKLGVCIADQFRDKLNVDGVDGGFACSDNRYTGEEGVFARNFRMTRLVAGPVCLGEPLIQNHPKEAKDLSPVQNGEIPERIRQVAMAYHDAIVRYAREMK